MTANFASVLAADGRQISWPECVPERLLELPPLLFRSLIVLRQFGCPLVDPTLHLGEVIASRLDLPLEDRRLPT